MKISGNDFVTQASKQAKVRVRMVKNTNGHDPPQCPLCGTQINSMITCITHLSGKKHIKKLGEVYGYCDEKCTENKSRLVSMLTCPTQRDVHLAYGFKVDKILVAVEKGGEGVQPRFDGAKEKALLMPPDFNWLAEEYRHFVGWDGRKQKGISMMPLTKSASIENSIHRVQVGQMPPAFNPPTLPLRLPAVKRSSIKLQWPHRPGLLLPFALFKAKGQSFDEIDVIASTSFLYALAGNSAHMNDCFLMQKIGGAVAIQHLRKKSHHSIEIGPLVEQLCCPPNLSSTSSHSISKLKIGGRSLLIASEVDGYDSSTGASVEVKARLKDPFPGIKDLIQIMTNGSTKIVNLRPSKDSLSLECLTTYDRSEILDRRKDQWIYAGQRIRYLLPIVLNNPNVKNAIASPVMMTFDQAKMPQFAPAPPGYSVIPPDY